MSEAILPDSEPIRLPSGFRAWLRTEVPLNFRTLLFAYMMGAVLSIPLGILYQAYDPHDTPEWEDYLYTVPVLCSFLALPWWSYYALRPWPILWKMGVRFSLALLILYGIALLFPAL